MTTVLNIFGGPGLGKAQPLTAKILTPTGWSSMAKMVVGSEVISKNGNITTVTNVSPQGEKDIYTIFFHDGSSTQACLDHLWDCWYIPKRFNKRTHSVNKRSEQGVLTTKDLIYQLNRPNHGSFKFNVSIPLFTPKIDDTDIELPIDPYLLGLLLGDGCISTRNISYTSIDESLIESINTQLHHIGQELVSYDQSPNYVVRSTGSQLNTLADLVDQCGLLGTKSDTKFVPDVYKKSSYAQRIELIRGLMDTDGTVDNKGCCSYTTSSDKLAADFQQLMWSLGATCSIANRIPHYNDINGDKIFCKLSHTLQFNAPDKSIFYKLNRKINRVRPTNPVSLRRRVVSIEHASTEHAQCISVDDSSQTYITDDYIVTHNSTTAAGLFHMMKKNGDDVELVTEYAKDMVWEQRPNIMDDQIYMFAKQYRKIARLRDQVKFVIVDSPILMCCAYIRPGYFKTLEPLILETFNSFNNINFLLTRNTKYDSTGRMQTAVQAASMDSTISEVLDKYNTQYDTVDPFSDDTLSIIYDKFTS